MDHAPKPRQRPSGAEIVDFGEAALDACPAGRQVELMTEATMLASAFAPKRRAAEIRSLARSLRSGVHDQEMGRAHAWLVAAALRRLASGAKG
jgi:plasmid stabilization system protein ParE